MNPIWNDDDRRPHAVMVPFPAQGHINPMMKLAKLLHHRGFHITFVHSEHNHRRLLASRGPSALDGASNFRFAAIPDGDSGGPQDVVSMAQSIKRKCLAPFKDLVAQLNSGGDQDVPPVSCIVWDTLTTFALVAARELGVSDVHFWIASACGLLPILYLPHLVHNGLLPLKDESCFPKDWIPGMMAMRYKDFPSFITTKDSNDNTVNHLIDENKSYNRASVLILNTFDALEHHCLSSISSILHCPVYSIGPLQLLETQMLEDGNKIINKIGTNLWREETKCLKWLDAKEAYSVLYVNFGSMAVMTSDQVVELACGLAYSDTTFLWVVRPDIFVGGLELLIGSDIGERGMLASWCPQEEVLNHRAVGGFLTHCGWNSLTESICAGVPVICWPFFADQPTIRGYCCMEWGIGLEIEGDGDEFKRGDVEKAVREMMEGERGKELKKKVLDWKDMAHQATKEGGLSRLDLDKVVTHLSKTTTTLKYPKA